MKRAYELGCWAVMAVGCSFNQTPTDPRVDPPPSQPFLNGEAISAEKAPAPISGGTLLVTAGGKLAFASNPDANVVDVIDLEKRTVVWSADVGDGAEPGRLVEDANGLVHVVLRKAGAIATLDPVARTVTKRDVCAAPRGITVNNGAVYVACQSGEIVSIFDNGTTSKKLDRDLRDVVVRVDGSMYVTRFRSAEVLDLDPKGNLVGRMSPDNQLNRSTDGNDQVVSARFQPDAAWRSAPAPDGSLYVLHQYATTRAIAIKPPTNDNRPNAAPYGGGGPEDPCGNNKLVVPALTRIASGQAPRTIRLRFDAPGFDMAIAPSGRIAIAGAANQVTSFVPSFPDVADPGTGCDDPSQPVSSVATTGQPIAVAFGAGEQLIVQTRDPARLVINLLKGTGYVTNEIPLSNSAHDTGFAVFHTPTQAGIACVSCHPEGGDDGHTWSFVELGQRRTQNLRGGIMATAPFHWGGDMHDVSQLAHDVFTNRMGGGALNEPQIGVLASWIDRQPALATAAVRQPDAVQHGQVLFASSGCTTCHSGGHLTNNQNADVGTGGSFQVPSLVGVASRAPFMHDGCAPTLMDRFVNAKCGGDHHGDTSKLSAADLSDLVSYLETL